MQALTIKDIWTVIKKNFLWLVAIPIIMVLLTITVYSQILSKQYTSTAQIFITVNPNKNSAQSYESILMTKGLTDTYSKVIKSPKVLKHVQKDTRVELSQLSKNLTVDVDEDSLVFTMTFKDFHPKKSKQVVNAVAKYSSTSLKSLLSGTKVTMISKGEIGTPVSNINKYILAFIAGVLLSLFFLLVQLISDTRLKNEDELENMGVIVLGDVPNIKSTEGVEV